MNERDILKKLRKEMKEIYLRRWMKKNEKVKLKGTKKYKWKRYTEK